MSADLRMYNSAYFNHMIERMMQQPNTSVPMTSSVIPLYIPLPKLSAVVYVFVLDSFKQSTSIKMLLKGIQFGN